MHMIRSSMMLRELRAGHHSAQSSTARTPRLPADRGLWAAPSGPLEMQLLSFRVHLSSLRPSASLEPGRKRGPPGRRLGQ